MSDLNGKTMIMSGGSRGIGLAIATRAAQDGANVVLLAKTDTPHPKLEGTIHTAVEQLEAAGGAAVGVLGDVRIDADVQRAVDTAVERFGGIDIVVNNASAIDLRNIEQVDMKRYDLMQNINCRGTFLLSKTAIPHLKQSDNGHVLTLSPPLSLDPKWFANHCAYTLAKFGMSMVALGLAGELREAGVASNALWPRTMIATAAVQNLLGGEQSMRMSRTPEIMADAAHAILTRPAREYTGNFAIDDEVLAEAGITDLERYLAPGATPESLATDLFL